MPHNNNVADVVTDAELPRRVAIKQMATLFGLSLSAQALDVLAKPTVNSPQAAKLLNEAELQMTGEIAELIIPTTDTPGARAVDVHGFIDRYLVDCTSKADQRKFTNGLKKINATADNNFHKHFLLCDEKQRISLLHGIEKRESGFNAADKQFFTFFKSLTLLGYYTSEVGATKELAYLAIPGGYKGSFPFANIGKAWSLN